MGGAPYKIDRCGNLWIIEARSGTTVKDVERMLREMSSAQALYRLWIIPDAIDLEQLQVSSLSAFANGQDFRSQVSAVVCPHDLTFGIGRMFESLAEADGRKVRVFRNQEEARSWLKSVQEWDKDA